MRDPTRPRWLWWLRGTWHEIRYGLNVLYRRPREALHYVRELLR